MNQLRLLLLSLVDIVVVIKKRVSTLPSQNISISRHARALMGTLLLLSILSPSFAQDRCGTVEYTNNLKSQKSLLESTEQFEEWLKGKIQSTTRTESNKRGQTATYQIPVVVHVIHNGETVGNGTNISDDQINSQIAVMNKDYQRLNADATNTPAEFLGVAGSFDLEFVLAKQNPEGLATTGIERVPGTKTSWSINDNYELKSLSYWPAEDYLNIWVCNITDYLGYAQFPVSGLPGLENASFNRLTDGVVIYYRSFGSEDDGPFDLDNQYNKGRTATHEVGHFLGLRHIWGDDGGACGGSGDYVVDTPDQSNSSSGCPAHPRVTCTVNSMFQNYMDYTDDGCMNLFTMDQVTRMTTVLENSIRRASLLTSHALQDPQPVADDAGIKSILSPLASECSNVITPSIEVKNYGNNTVTSVRVRFILNSALIETKDVAVNLAALESSVINFAPQSLSTGTSTFLFDILLTNGIPDGNSFNNTGSRDVFIPQGLATPFIESFNTFPSSWTVQDPDNFTAWQLVNAPNGVPSNKAMYMNFYDYEDGEGEIDLLLTPNIDLSAVPIAVLYFDVAHARFQSSNDGLRVYVLSDCNQNIYDGTLIYSKSGSTLATTTSTNIAFVPNGASQWRKEAVNLNDFVGQDNIQLAFVGYNDWGNNLYVDNISILTSQLKDLALGEIKPDLITCNEDVEFKITVNNVGTDPISSFQVTTTVDGGSPQTTSFSGLNIPSGENLEVELNAVALSSGNNNLHIEIINPNGVADSNPSDNGKEFDLQLNTSNTPIPYRESFETFFGNDWVILNPTGGMEWETITTPAFGKSVYFNAFDNAELGDKAWLISPVLDFSSATEASLQFYASYGQQGIRKENLKVMYSLDCGNYFEPVAIFDEEGEELSSIASSSEWTPENTDDWELKLVDLTFLKGKKDLRFAFVATNDNGNNLYVDNINFSTSKEPNPLLEDELYVIYYKEYSDCDFYLTFNLPESQSIRYEVVDVMGRTLVSSEMTDVLNQTFPVTLSDGTKTGVYIVRLGIGDKFYATKVYVSR